ncbi:hypothetical protein RK21_02037 [Pseudomonas plecoglossicida]|nr:MULTISPECIES: TonB-dependent receptor [Pseudomonas]AJG13545.1 hypothetical protein RK21_02037 [Pseudomonas plecoglossicida]MDD1983672.1 TonB-dependent receptor [Pseudomonas asiatica]
MRWQGTEYYKGAGPNDETFTQDPYSIFDLMAQYTFTPQTSVSLNLNNVFDKKLLHGNWFTRVVWLSA